MQQELPLAPDTPKAPPASGSKPSPRPRAPRKPKPPPRADMRLTGWVAGLVIALDQALKYWVVHVLQLDRLREIDVIPPWLNLRMAWNQGVNFGLFASGQDMMRWILIGVAVAISVWVWIWVWRSAIGILGRLSAGLLIGGALGNVIDRILYGAVADFLNMSLPGWQNPYSFNVADIAIFLGAIGLILLPQTPAKAATTRGRASSGRSHATARGKRTPRPAKKPADNPRDEAGK